jgi:serralysin
MTGSGNDTIWCNDIDNVVSAGAGADTTIFGGGYDVLRDTLANLNGDTVFNFATKGSLDVLGTLVGRNSLTIQSAGQAIFQFAGTYTTLNGNFVGGDFMVAQRGSGTAADTSLAFVPYLPTLAERQRVASSAINGIANQAFLTGDGSVQFTLNFQSAVSSFANELGEYQVGPDGIIHDVRLLYGNSLAVGPAQQSLSLGTPGAGQRIGFFLIPNASNVYGALPNDLSFVAQDGSTPGNINSDGPLVLQSASRGQLTSTDVFHSFSALNPDGANQVLSGMQPSGQDLFIAFEDTRLSRSDADYNDVVVSVHANKGIG